jgi:hypothetical protein
MRRMRTLIIPILAIPDGNKRPNRRTSLPNQPRPPTQSLSKSTHLHIRRPLHAHLALDLVRRRCVVAIFAVPDGDEGANGGASL